MQRCYDFYVAARRVTLGEKLSVVEIGSEEFNGAYREIFADERFAYTGCDRAPGPGVDIVLDDPYNGEKAPQEVMQGGTALLAITCSACKHRDDYSFSELKNYRHPVTDQG